MSTSSTRPFSFQLEHTCGQARAGVVRTARNVVQTPVFMPVATHAAVRGQDSDDLHGLGFGILLANTYHLLLRPGPDVFRKFGSIHGFMKWPGSVLTDSGGYQLFSLSSHLRMSEEGAEFRSYVDGQKILLTPEVSIATQGAIGSDIMMVLDQCVASTSDRETTRAAMHLTHRWAHRSFAARGDSPQALFGIVQGGCFHDLRAESAAQITGIPFDGYAIGGVAVGEERSIRDDIVAYTAALLPRDRPRYLMGVGTPLDILEGVARGMDMFDCIIPTAMAEQSLVFTSRGKVRLMRGVYAGVERPIDDSCSCSTCARYSRGYIHHLFKAGEHLAATLAGIHNLAFFRRLVIEIREEIVKGTFESYYTKQRDILGATDLEAPVTPPRARSSKVVTDLGDYTIHRHEGTAWIKQRSSGEVMHSVTAPHLEADRLYVQQSNLRRRSREIESGTLVIWDVGLGAANNALAAITAYEAEARLGEPLRPLQLVSFENDLNPLRLAIKNLDSFNHLRHPAPHAALARKVWRSKACAIEWEILEGDFLATLENAPVPEVIFYDPFSYKTNPALWSLEAFSKLLAKVGEAKVALYTYSASTRVRSGLLAAGWYVARGASAGPKSDTTIAVTHSESSSTDYHFLDKEWLMRWERSDSKVPLGVALDRELEISALIRGHQQFSRIDTD